MKLHPVSERFSVRLPIVTKIAKLAALRDVPLIFHTQMSTEDDQDFMSAFEEFIDSIIYYAPMIKIIMGHSGMMFGVDGAIRVARKYPRNIWLDISVNPNELVEELLLKVGAEQMIFGTDLPFGRGQVIRPVLEFLNDSSLRSGDIARILCGNVAKIISRDLYWRGQQNEVTRDESSKGECAIIRTSNPMEELKRLVKSPQFSLVEPIINPIDFSGRFFVESIAYAYVSTRDFSLTFVADSSEARILVFNPSLRFQEISSGKSSPIRIEEGESEIISDGIPSSRFYPGILTSVLGDWQNHYKLVKLRVIEHECFKLKGVIR